MNGNPLHDGLRLEPTPGPTTLVIFGASGDLTRRKLLPAVYRLSRRGRLPAQFAVIGISREPDGRRGVQNAVPREPEGVRRARGRRRRGRRIAGEPDVLRRLAKPDDPAFYQRLQARLTEIDGAEGVLFYLAIPPTVYATVIEHLGASGLADAPQRGWRRIIVEKPFGTDLDSARALNRLAHEHFDEDQVYRIDHYLGKETVQNLLVFRFANGMFEPVWNRRYIDHVQITAAETVGVEHRAAYYEGAGATRDMVQNHLMQVMSLVAMEPPIAFTAESVRDRKMDALLAVQPLVSNGAGKTPPGSHVVRAQYREGWVNGAEVPGYRTEKGVDPASTDRDVRGRAPEPRQLALGRRPLLSADRETSAQADDGDLHPVPPSAARDLQACESCLGRTQSARGQRAARRRDLAAVRDQAAGHTDADRAGDDELQVRNDVWRRSAGSVRDAAARCDAR